MAPIRRASQRADFPSQPSDMELATTHLRRFIDTGDRPNFVHEANVYDASPGRISLMYPPAIASDGQEAWYFITILHTKSRRGWRKSRTVRSGELGSWHSERAPKPLMAGFPHSRQIGYRQSFCFATKVDGRLVRSGWLMAEIGLNFDGSSVSQERSVICKIYRTPRIGQAYVTLPTLALDANGSTAAAVKGKEGEDPATSEEDAHIAETAKGPAQPPLGYSAQLSSDIESKESDTSDTELTESDSEGASSTEGGAQIRRVITGNAARTACSEALPSAPIRRNPAAPRWTTTPYSDASLPSHPSDQEIVETYLIPRIASGENYWKFIHEFDVYTAEPAYLTVRFTPATASDGQKAWYFFTLLRSKSIHGRRRPRMVGEGCWHSESGTRSVFDGSRPIGRRQFFSFMKKEGAMRVRTGWIMVEVGLSHGQEEGPSDELVLCKVYRSPRAGPAPDPMALYEREMKSIDNFVAVQVSKATATASSSSSSFRRKRKAKDNYPGTACPVLCARCQIETLGSHSGTAAEEEDDESRRRSDTGLLEDSSAADDESVGPPASDADSSDRYRPPFYQFV